MVAHGKNESTPRGVVGDRIYNRERQVGCKATRCKNPEEDWVVAPKAHEAIVSREMFDRVQQVLTAKRPRSGSTRAFSSSFLLTPILWCRRHSCRYVAYPNQERLYYIRSERNKSGNAKCPCPLLKKEAVEEFILRQFRDEIFTPERVRPILDELVQDLNTRGDEVRRQAEGIRGELKRLEGELSNLHKAIAEGVPAFHLKSPIGERLARQAELQSTLGKLKDTETDPVLLELNEELVEIMSSGLGST